MQAMTCVFWNLSWWKIWHNKFQKWTERHSRQSGQITAYRIPVYTLLHSCVTYIEDISSRILTLLDWLQRLAVRKSWPQWPSNQKPHTMLHKEQSNQASHACVNWASITFMFHTIICSLESVRPVSEMQNTYIQIIKSAHKSRFAANLDMRLLREISKCTTLESYDTLLSGVFANASSPC